MALANDDEVINYSNLVKRVDEPFKTATIVDKDTRIDKLVPYIDGYSWKVKYYNQIKGEDDLLSGIDITVAASLQQYASIDNLVLKVQSPLSDGDIENISGTALVTGGLIPQVEDHFTVTLASRRPALMRVSAVEKKHYSLSEIFEITYVLDSFIDTDPTRYNNLLTKIAKEFYFDEDYVQTNSNPIMLLSTYKVKKLIQTELPGMGIYYVNKIRDRETRLLKVPESNMIDLELQSFFLSLVDTSRDKAYQYLNIVGFNDRPITNSIFEILLRKEHYNLNLAKKKATTIGFGNRATFDQLGTDENQTLLNLKYLGIIGRYTYGEVNDVVLTWSDTPYASEYLGLLPNETTLGESYLFTAEFYDEDLTNSSRIEKLLGMYLHDETLPDDDIILMLTTYKKWSNTEIYFYLPFVILLLKYKTDRTRDILYRNQL